MKSETAVGEIGQEATAMAQAGEGGQRRWMWVQKLFGGGGAGLLDILAGDAHGTCRWTVLQQLPHQQTGNTETAVESKMAQFQTLALLLPGWRTSPTATSRPEATAKEWPEEDEAEKSLRGNRQQAG